MGPNHPSKMQPKTPSTRNKAETMLIRASERALTAVLRSQIKHNLTSHPGEDLAFPPPQKGIGYTLYAHIPFCESLCPYCSFNRFLYESDKAGKYFNALRTEMQNMAALGYDFKTLYIGGGTPTINLDELVRTIDLARELFDIQEVSCETNPNHLTPKYVEALKDRVQRMSVGVQSFDTSLLREMNRLEKFGDGEQIAERIKFAAPYFDSLNVDMIFNFPNQTSEILAHDLEMVIQSGAQQVTFYPLMSSNSVKNSLAKSVGKPDHQREWALFNQINDCLSGEFSPLSAWTFVRNTAGMLDEYIVDSEEYVGIGSGAFSYVNGSLYVNNFSVNEYINSINNQKSAINGVKRYDLPAQMRYWFMMNLFSTNFDRQAFYKRFGKPIWLGLPIEMLFLNLMGSFKNDDRNLLTRRGQYYSLVMMREFFSGVNNVRDLARKNLPPLEMTCATPAKQASSHPLE